MGKKKGADAEKRKERILKKRAAAQAAPADDEFEIPKPKKPPTAMEIGSFPALKYLSINNIVQIDACIEALVAEQKMGLQTIESRDDKKVWNDLVESADKAVSKVFRRSSVQVHPDRYGDQRLTEFENLKQAYEILGTNKSRTDYINKLLVVARLWGINHQDFLQREHDGFLQFYEEKQAQEENTRERYNTKTTGSRQATNYHTTTNYHIESHHWSRSPGWLDIYQTHPKCRQVDMGFQFRDPTYRDVCRRIVMQGHELHDAEAQIQQIWEGDKLQRLWESCVSENPSSPALHVTISLPTHTEWTLRWKVELVVEDQLEVTSSSTMSRTVDMTHPDITRARSELPSLLQIAKRQAGTLKSLTRNNNHNIQRENIESHSWVIHHCMSKSRSLLSRLKTTMTFLERDEEECGELTELVETLAAATRIKTELDAQVYVEQRRDTLKNFKRHVAQRIEAGEAAEWIRTVEKDELGPEGSEANRLYQLLMEGKKANALLADPATLVSAADRVDLFSGKQCKMLRERAQEAEIEIQKETERLVAETKRQIEAQELEQQLVQRAARIGIERGACVSLYGIVQRSELNGRLGYFMGVASQSKEERYTIKLLGDDFPPKEVALKKENFRLWDGGGGWSPRLEQTNDSVPNHDVDDSSSSDDDDEEDDDNDDDESVESVFRQSAVQDETPTRKANNPVASPRDETATDSTTTLQSTEPCANPATRPPRTKDTVWISHHLVASIVGKKGANIKKLQNETRTTISIRSRKNGWVPVKVFHGSKANIAKALDLVEAFEGPKSADHAHVLAVEPDAAYMHPSNINGHPDTSSLPSDPGQSSIGSRPYFQDNSEIETTRVASAARAENRSSPGGVVPASVDLLQSYADPPHIDAPMRTFPPSLPPAQSSVRSNIPNPMTATMSVSQFLAENRSSFKTSPDDFCRWLQSEDIETFEDLVEGCNDDDFLQEMVKHGLKSFKKAAFRKAVSTAIQKPQGSIAPISQPKARATDNKWGRGEGPSELYCPISFVLMQDPVLAADGFTYERFAIAAWFAENAGGAVLSPMTQEPLRNLELNPNVAIRNMAKDFTN